MAKDDAVATAALKPRPGVQPTRTPPEHAKAHGIEPVDAAGVRATGGWTIYDQVTNAAYRAALRRWMEGTNHAG